MDLKGNQIILRAKNIKADAFPRPMSKRRSFYKKQNRSQQMGQSAKQSRDDFKDWKI